MLKVKQVKVKITKANSAIKDYILVNKFLRKFNAFNVILP